LIDAFEVNDDFYGVIVSEKWLPDNALIEYGNDWLLIVNSILFLIASKKVAYSEIFVVLNWCLPNGILNWSKYCALGVNELYLSL
jgi:hypothetical protein